MSYHSIYIYQYLGLDYWLIFEDGNTIGDDPVASCNHEEDANRIVEALNNVHSVSGGLR